MRRRRLSHSRPLASRRLQRIAFRGGDSPSTGMVAVAFLSQMCGNVTVYGLGGGRFHHRSSEGGRSLPNQYFRLRHTERGFGNNAHSFGAEEAVLEVLAKAGRLRLCGEEETCAGGDHADDQGSVSGGKGKKYSYGGEPDC